MAGKIKLYGEISKTEELDDGTIKVWGYASSGNVDSDGEVITPDAMKAALPDYMKFGAVREMHQAKAAGTAIEADVQDDGRTYFGALVVDSEAVKKVKAGVYKGFSIGGKVTERDELNKAVIKGLKLVEVSLVDRPANPDAVFTCYKSESIDANEGEAQDAEAAAVDSLADLLDKGAIKPSALVALAQDAIAKAATPDAPAAEPEQAAPSDTVEKGLWDISHFAGVLDAIGSLARSAEWESQAEGDNSALPAAIRKWLADGIAIFKDMAAEETAELVAALNAMVPPPEVTPEVVEMADAGGDLAKAGARFSKDTKDALANVHAAAKACCEHLDKLGYAGDADKAEQGDDLAKVSGELDLAKAEVTRLTDELAKAQAAIAEHNAKPAPGKALLKVLAKSADVLPDAAPVADEIEPTLKGEALAMHQLKKMFSLAGSAR